MTMARTCSIHGGWTDGQKQMDSASPFAQALKLEEKGQVIKFLDDTPYANFRRHWVDRTNPGAPPTRRAYVCPQTVNKDCPLCDLGDRAQAVSAFNVVVLGDDDQILHKTWDCGARLFQVLKAYANDPKIGPLTEALLPRLEDGPALQRPDQRHADQDHGPLRGLGSLPGGRGRVGQGQEVHARDLEDRVPQDHERDRCRDC